MPFTKNIMANLFRQRSLTDHKLSDITVHPDIIPGHQGRYLDAHSPG